MDDEAVAAGQRAILHACIAGSLEPDLAVAMLETLLDEPMDEAMRHDMILGLTVVQAKFAKAVEVYRAEEADPDRGCPLHAWIARWQGICEVWPARDRMPPALLARFEGAWPYAGSLDRDL